MLLRWLTVHFIGNRLPIRPKERGDGGVSPLGLRGVLGRVRPIKGLGQTDCPKFQKMWVRVGLRRWEWTSNVAPEPVDRTSQVPSTSREDPREKCKLWRSAIARSDVPPSDSTYLDILDDYTKEYIQHLAAYAVIQDRRKKGWGAVHQEFSLLPRCPVHDTVSFDSLAYWEYIYRYDRQCAYITGCLTLLFIVAIMIWILYVTGALGLVE